MEREKLELLHAHYVDTFTYVDRSRRQRDRLFQALLVLVGVMLFEIATPGDFGSVVAALLKKQVGVLIDFAFLRSLIWFAMLAISVRYFQAVIHVSRSYDYVHQLEVELSREYPEPLFTREGASYLAGYPTFSRWAHALYQVVFPALLLIVTTTKFVADCRESGVTGWLVFDAAIYTAIGISVLLYLRALYSMSSDAHDTAENKAS